MNTENIIEYLEKNIAFYNIELEKDFNSENIKIFIKGKKEHAKEMIEFLKPSTDVSKCLFLCDICGQEKSGKKFPVLYENWNKQSGLNQCEDCFKEGCGID